MRDDHNMAQTRTANAVLTLDASTLNEPVETGEIRAHRVIEARARLAAGLIPLTAEDLAEAILRSTARERLCRA